MGEMKIRRLLMVMMILIVVSEKMVVDGSDTNEIYDPCSDAKVRYKDGFTFGLAFSSKEAFFFNQTQLSPCDQRLGLASKGAQLAAFRPKVDEMSLLSINSTSFNPGKVGGYMVAFAGRKYAARSFPAFVADGTNIVTSFTLVLEFQKGTLQNLFWKPDGCDKCSGHSTFVCLNHTDCAVPASKCQAHGGSMDCNIGIQLAFSGTDRDDTVLNSWYEVKNLRKYSLFGLYSELRDSVNNQYNNFI